MEMFVGNTPDLINASLIKDIEKKLCTGTEKQKINEICKMVYENYVQCNMFPIIVVVLLCMYLFIKYIIKNQNTATNKKQQKYQRMYSQMYQQLHPQTYQQTSNDTLAFNGILNDDDLSSYISDEYLLTDTVDEINNNKINNNAIDSSDDKNGSDKNFTNLVRSNPNFNFDNIGAFNYS